jgi:hypothetical protein
MLMTLHGAQITMAAIWQVDPLNQLEFLQFFEGSVNCNQANARVVLTGKIIYFKWAESAAAVGNDFDQGSAGGRQAVSRFLQQV